MSKAGVAEPGKGAGLKTLSNSTKEESEKEITQNNNNFIIKNAECIIIPERILNLWLTLVEQSDRREITKKDLKNRTLKFWNFVSGKITPERLLDYSKKYAHKEDRRIARNFLKFAAKQLQEDILQIWADEFLQSPKKKKDKALFAEDEQEATKTIDEIREVIYEVLKSKINDITKIRIVAGMVLAASTGLRPYELGRLSFEEIEQAIKDKYFILPAEISKTPFRRVIPVNKECVDLLKIILRLKDKIKGDKPFAYKTIQNRLREHGIGITLEDLRHFATTYSLTVLGVPGITEAAIAAHDTDKYGIRLEHYVRKKPEEIRDDYLKFWDNVKLLSKEQLDKIYTLVNRILSD